MVYTSQIASSLLSLQNHFIKSCPYPRFQTKAKLLSAIAAYNSLDCLLSRKSAGRVLLVSKQSCQILNAKSSKSVTTVAKFLCMLLTRTYHSTVGLDGLFHCQDITFKVEFIRSVGSSMYN